MLVVALVVIPGQRRVLLDISRRMNKQNVDAGRRSATASSEDFSPDRKARLPRLSLRSFLAMTVSVYCPCE